MRSPLTRLAWGIIGFLVVVILGICLCRCSLPFLQVANPTYTVQLLTLDGAISVKIPAELPDFVTEGTCCNFKISEKLYGMKFRGIIKDTHGRLIDYYILVIKRGKPSKVIALRAVQMPTDKFWIYVKGEPVPASMDQVKEKIEDLTGKKI